MVRFSPPPFVSDSEENSNFFLSSINGTAAILTDSLSRASTLDPVLSNTSQLLTGTASYKSIMDPLPASINTPGQGIDIPLASLLFLNSSTIPATSGSRRARSGSLFSTNSIWNDDALLLNSPSRALLNSGIIDIFSEITPATAPGATASSSSSFISPVLSAQPSSIAMANSTRNRSHTTSNHSMAFGLKSPPENSKMGTSPFLLAVPEPYSLLENMALNTADPQTAYVPTAASAHGSRNRSQTYSGVTLKLSELTMATGSYSRPPQPLNMKFQFADHPNQSFDYHMNLSTKENLQDDFDIFDLSIITSFDNPNLGPTNTLLLDNLPHFIDSAGLYKLLSNPTVEHVGHYNAGIKSVRVGQRTNSKLALVECISIEAAMNIKAGFNHLEIMPGVILYVAFAKVCDNLANTVAHISNTLPASIPATINTNPTVEANKGTKSSLRSSSSNNTVESLMDIVSRLSASQPIDLQKVVSIIKKAAAFPNSNYRQSFGSLPEQISARHYDAPKLREMRKALESCEKALGQSTSDSELPNDAEILSQNELEELCLSILDELPEICYDHIGNTVVQKLFTVVESPVIKLIMVKEITPYFAQLGIHKNGTWAIQKIINNSVDFSLPKVSIAQSLKPYAAKLFNDQFGNYVLQCCLKFGSPYNDFIFETAYDNFLEISCGRFGARCLRAILETSSPSSEAFGDSNSTSNGVVSNEQLHLIASLIVENAPKLVINNNGSLLITWFLDTFTGCKNAEYDFRYGLLCDKLMPSLEIFCTHKLGSLTIYKILNNRIDTSVRTKIMNAIFGVFDELMPEQLCQPCEILEAILQESSDNNSGPLFIYKILTNPSCFGIGNENLNQRYQQFAISQVKRVLVDANVTNQQSYKKLMEEVGLSPSKMGKSATGGKTTKRGSNNHAGMGNRLGDVNAKGGLGNFGMVMHFPHPSQMMPHMMNYKNGSPGMYAPNMPAYGGQGYDGNGGYVYNNRGYNMGMMQMQQEQDFSVMYDLEQLSLSSAAMGYGSNPQTPLASIGLGQDGLFF